MKIVPQETPQPANPTIQSGQVPQKPASDPFCTTRCCGTRWGWQDGVMFTVETLTLGAAGTSAVIAALTTTAAVANVGFGIAAVLGVTGVVEGVAHYFWHRDAIDADLHRADQELGEELKEMTATEQKTEEVVTKLQSANTQMAQENLALLKAQDEIARVRDDLTQQVNILVGTNKSLVEQNASMVEQNRILQQQVQRLQEIMNIFKDNVAKFNSQNLELKSNIKNLDNVVMDFGKEKDSLVLAASDIDKTLGVDINNLTRQVALMQQTSNEVLQAVAQEIQTLESDIAKMQSSQKEIDKDSDAIAAKVGQLNQLQKQYNDVQSALQSSQAEFAKISDALANAKNALADTLEKMRSVDTKITSDSTHLDQVTQALTKIASELDTLGSKVAQDVNSLNALSSETQKQKDEIAKL